MGLQFDKDPDKQAIFDRFLKAMAQIPSAPIPLTKSTLLNKQSYINNPPDNTFIHIQLPAQNVDKVISLLNNELDSNDLLYPPHNAPHHKVNESQYKTILMDNLDSFLKDHSDAFDGYSTIDYRNLLKMLKSLSKLIISGQDQLEQDCIELKQHIEYVKQVIDNEINKFQNNFYNNSKINTMELHEVIKYHSDTMSTVQSAITLFNARIDTLRDKLLKMVEEIEKRKNGAPNTSITTNTKSQLNQFELDTIKSWLN